MTNKKYYTTLLFYLAAFFLPVLIMIGVLYSQKIYPGSERTILTSDGFHQYVIFATELDVYKRQTIKISIRSLVNML